MKFETNDSCNDIQKDYAYHQWIHDHTRSLREFQRKMEENPTLFHHQLEQHQDVPSEGMVVVGH